MPETTQPLQILIVDDNQGDIALMIEAARKNAPGLEITFTTNPENAVQMLHDRQDVGRPFDLVLLDLNMPRKNGFSVLTDIRKDPALRHIPVLILTSSRSDGDVRMAYDLKSNAYLIKPVEFTELGELMGSVQDFWSRNTQPPNGLKARFIP